MYPDSDDELTPEEREARNRHFNQQMEAFQLKRDQSAISALRFIHGAGGATTVVFAGWGVWHNLDNPWPVFAGALSMLGAGLAMLVAFAVSLRRDKHMTPSDHSSMLRRWFIWVVAAVTATAIAIGVVAEIIGA